MRKFRHVLASGSQGDIDSASDEEAEHARLEELGHVLRCTRTLTPQLMEHLRNHFSDIEQIPPEIFEHLVGEILASWGWDEVRHVGRDSTTSADILAGFFDSRVGERTRYFVEVKRWKRKIGIEIVNQVLGAMITERPKFGWHAAMIVTVTGAKLIRKYTKEELALRGVWIKDKEDVERWLGDYRPSPSGLWLPNSLGSK